MGGDQAAGTEFAQITVLQREQQKAQALELLTKAAQLVAPIMRSRKWKVNQLTEFFPNNPNLLGLNINRRQVIRVRLRPAENRNSFYDFDFIVGTLLHELAHVVHGPHNAAFYKLLEKLQDEATSELVHQKFGYKPSTRTASASTTPSFQSFTGKGRVLGHGPRSGTSDDLAASRNAALRHHGRNPATTGRRLGRGLQAQLDIDWAHAKPAAMAAAAAYRRAQDNQWCVHTQQAAAAGRAARTSHAASPTLDAPNSKSARQQEPRTASSSRDQDHPSTRVPLRTTPARPTSPPASSWQCATCTFINTKSLAPICEVCQEPRPCRDSDPGLGPEAQASASELAIPVPPPPPSAAQRPWSCPSCEAPNSSQRTTCRRCKHGKVITLT